MAMSEKYLFRPYKTGDEEKIPELLSTVFKGWPHIDTDLSPIDFWKWKYHKNPVHPGYVSVGFNGDQLISCHHNMVLKIWIQDKAIYGGTALDFAVHPDYRGQGLSSKTSAQTKIQRKKDQAIFSYFITRNPKLIKKFTGTKEQPTKTPRFPFDILNLTKINDVDLHFRKIPVQNQALIKPGIQALKAWSKIKGAPKTESNLTVEYIDKFDIKIDSLLEKIIKEHKFMVIRSSTYLNWRYAYPGLGDYIKLVVKEKDRILGYSVLRINNYNQDYPIGYIVDLITEKGREDAVSVLVSKAVEYFESKDVNIVNCQLVKGHPYIKVLERYGFLDSRIKINLFTTNPEQGLSLEGLSNADPSQIYISWGDHDALPVGLNPHT